MPGSYRDCASLGLAACREKKLSGVLPKHWSHANPVDLIGDAGPDRYERALEILSDDPNSDGLLVILTPQATTDPNTIAATIAHSAQKKTKPMLASWMGGKAVAEGNAVTRFLRHTSTVFSSL